MFDIVMQNGFLLHWQPNVYKRKPFELVGLSQESLMPNN